MNYSVILLILSLSVVYGIRSARWQPQRNHYSTNNRFSIRRSADSSDPSLWTKSVGKDVNPVLISGTKNAPGILIRFNQRSFKYASIILGHIFDDEIRRVNLPKITHCMKELNGCVDVFNQYIARYRCPQRIAIYPSPPNRLNAALQNIDIGITGNIAGQIQILLPMPISGIIQINVHQLSIFLQMILHRSKSGKPNAAVSGCNIQIGYIDVYLQNAGLVGDIFNAQFKRLVAQQIREMIPNKLCELLYDLIPKKLNSKLDLIPRSIALTQISNLASTAFKTVAPPQCKTPLCQKQLKVAPKRKRYVTNNVMDRTSTANIRRARANLGSLPSMKIDPCNLCRTDEKNPLIMFRDMLKLIDTKKVEDLALTTQITNVFATPDAYTLTLNGEFSPFGRGGTPFGAFPLKLPNQISSRMFDVLISDYTINTLFYHMHKKGFLTFRLDPETPKIGSILKTTCGDDDDYDFEDPGVEIDEDNEKDSKSDRKKRDTEEPENDDLGICLGDIMPAIREKYPKQNVSLFFRSYRAPSIIFSSMNGGKATIELIIDGEVYIADSKVKVGLIRIAGAISVNLLASSGKLTGTIELSTLKLTDVESTLGLPQDALNNLANLGREIIVKFANDAFKKGIDLQIPTSNLPFTVIHPFYKIIDHSMYISTDIIISRSLVPVVDRSCKTING